MKTRALIIGFLFVIIVALMTAPVSADTTGTTALTGNPTAYVVITVNPNTIPLTLTPGASATDNTLDIHLTSNKACTVSVADSTGRAGGDQGYMGNFTASYEASPLNTKLASPIQLVGTASPPAGVTVSALTPPISTAQTLFTGIAGLNNVNCNTNTFTQPVAYTDPVLPSGSSYKIDLTFTIAAS